MSVSVCVTSVYVCCTSCECTCGLGVREYVSVSMCMWMSIPAYHAPHLVARGCEILLAVVGVLPPPCPPGHEARQRLVPQVHHRRGKVPERAICHEHVHFVTRSGHMARHDPSNRLTMHQHFPHGTLPPPRSACSARSAPPRAAGDVADHIPWGRKARGDV